MNSSYYLVSVPVKIEKIMILQGAKSFVRHLIIIILAADRNKLKIEFLFHLNIENFKSFKNKFFQYIENK